MEKIFDLYKKRLDDRSKLEASSKAVLGLDFMSKMKNWIFVGINQPDEEAEWHKQML